MRGSLSTYPSYRVLRKEQGQGEAQQQAAWGAQAMLPTVATVRCQEQPLRHPHGAPEVTGGHQGSSCTPRDM